jgi:hypothetical protein
VAADSQSPAAPVCSEPPSGANPVVIELNPDLPAPRCAKANAAQKLHLVNRTQQPISSEFDGQKLSIAPGEERTIDKRLGDFLAPGVHRVSLAIYGGSGPEVWLLEK